MLFPGSTTVSLISPCPAMVYEEALIRQKKFSTSRMTLVKSGPWATRIKPGASGN